jgi:hypothetical protein
MRVLRRKRALEQGTTMIRRLSFWRTQWNTPTAIKKAALSSSSPEFQAGSPKHREP